MISFKFKTSPAQSTGLHALNLKNVASLLRSQENIELVENSDDKVRLSIPGWESRLLGDAACFVPTPQEIWVFWLDQEGNLRGKMPYWNGMQVALHLSISLLCWLELSLHQTHFWIALLLFNCIPWAVFMSIYFESGTHMRKWFQTASK